jgi:crotonobetainyl-CoA:carnitine CoA-transferase CaiB-like acyl-CoA transferase
VGPVSGTGVLDGITVLDLSWGISGPMAAMLLGDHGARVTKIEPPGGDPFRALSGYQVWQRGKRSAILDLKSPAGRDALVGLVADVDVLIESFEPGVTARLGIDFDTLAGVNPRLVYCSITGYGAEGAHAGRPAIDALVAARTGHQWEARGVLGGTIARLAGAEGMMPGLEAPPGCWVGAERDGPLFSGVPWPSLAAFYLATLAINAALRARELTGRGQHVETSLMQGVLCSTLGGWQRVEKPDTPNFQTWIIDPRAPKGFFRCADGRWTHHWVPLPGFVLGASQGDRLELAPGVESPRKAGTRISTSAEDMVLLHHYTPPMAEAVARFPSEEWIRVAAEVGVPVQPVRAPEEALVDPLLLADGCVAEVFDPELGPVRQVGQVYRLTACPNELGAAPARPGQHTDEVLAEVADRVRRQAKGTDGPSAPEGPGLPAPLDGIVVLDLGLAVAGPFGTQLLADLGATVIKVSALHDDFWMSNHIAMCCNRGKRSVAINLKDPEGLAILKELVRNADIVQHNMRYDAAERLGVDYESLRQVNPALIYCHTRGFERGPRAQLPGNDQTGAALAGSEWMDGGLDHDGNPVWSVTSLGDTGNGFLSAIAMVQALYHRDRTGQGQFVDTSIIYAHLLNNSMAWTTADGSAVGNRQSLDQPQLGWSALYRLYPTGDGWLCVALWRDDQWPALCAAIGRPDLTQDDRFATAEARRVNDSELRAILQDVLGTRPAAEWFAALDAAGVPCEVSSPDFVLSLFDDPEFVDKGWVASYDHALVGHMDAMGLLFDLSDTPGRIMGPPFIPGQHSRSILRQFGYTDDAIEDLAARGVILDR